MDKDIIDKLSALCRKPDGAAIIPIIDAIEGLGYNTHLYSMTFGRKHPTTTYVFKVILDSTANTIVEVVTTSREVTVQQGCSEFIAHLRKTL
jgi:hypothetical protein